MNKQQKLLERAIELLSERSCPGIFNYKFFMSLKCKDKCDLNKDPVECWKFYLEQEDK